MVLRFHQLFQKSHNKAKKMPFISGRKYGTPIPNKSFNDGFLEDDSGYKVSEEKCSKDLGDNSILKTPVKSLNDAFLQDDSGYRSPELSPEERSGSSRTAGCSAVNVGLRTFRKLRHKFSYKVKPRIFLRSRKVKEEPLDVLVSPVPSLITTILISAILYTTFISGATQGTRNMKYESIKFGGRQSHL